MSWFDHQEEHNQMGADATVGEKGKTNAKYAEVKLPGGTGFIPVNKYTCERVYEDEVGKPILMIIDEAAELLSKENGSGEEIKEENQLKAECISHIKSITQLGRSAGVHCLIATQRNDTSIIPGVIQNNCLSLDTELEVLDSTLGIK